MRSFAEPKTVCPKNKNTQKKHKELTTLSLSVTKRNYSKLFLTSHKRSTVLQTVLHPLKRNAQKIRHHRNPQ